MSRVAVRAALESAVANMTPAIDTFLEGEEVNPTAAPYQVVRVMFADPDNTEYGPSFIEQGVMQVTLRYPIIEGTAPADARGDLIRQALKRGSALVSGDTVVTVEKTPSIAAGDIDGDRWAVPVSIQFFAQITA